VLCRAMSGFYEVTAASGTAAAGDESASWHDSANTLVSHPAASRTTTAASDAARSPPALARALATTATDLPNFDCPASRTNLHNTLVDHAAAGASRAMRQREAAVPHPITRTAQERSFVPIVRRLGELPTGLCRASCGSVIARPPPVRSRTRRVVATRPQALPRCDRAAPRPGTGRFPSAARLRGRRWSRCGARPRP
jgi:hypothetical protein